MADSKNYTVPIQVEIGARGGLKISGAYIPKAQKALKEAILNELKKITDKKTQGKIFTVNVNPDLLPMGMSTAVGDFLEGLVFQGLNNYFISQGASSYESTPTIEAEAKLKRAFQTLQRSKYQKSFIEETKRQADKAVKMLITQLDISPEKMKQQIELIWEGGSSSEGDLKLIFDGKVIMIECKNYSDYFLDKNKGITYFTLADTNGKNFPRFWRFLKRKGDPVWTHDLGLPTNIWMDNVLGQGFKEYVENLPTKFSEYSGPSAPVFSYLLQKGSFASKNVDQRALIALDKIGNSGKEIKLSFNIDIQKLQGIGYIESIFGYGIQSFYSFYNGKSSELGYFEITQNSQEIIRQNSASLLNDKTKDPGWSTTFHFILTKEAINQFQ